jgi:hypothetical protein
MSWKKEKKEHPWVTKAQAKRIASDHKKHHFQTKGVHASNEREAASLGSIPNYKIQSVTRIHDNFYHVRSVASADFTKLHNGYKGVASRRVL